MHLVRGARAHNRATRMEALSKQVRDAIASHVLPVAEAADESRPGAAAHPLAGRARALHALMGEAYADPPRAYAVAKDLLAELAAMLLVAVFAPAIEKAPPARGDDLV